MDQAGYLLDTLVQSRPDAKAAKRFMAQLMTKRRRVPRVLITDKMRSCPVAHGELMRSAEHRAHKPQQQAETGHQTARQRERATKGFRTAWSAQKFLSVFSEISPHFRPCHAHRRA